MKKILIVKFDVTNLSEDQIDTLQDAVSVQGEGVQVEDEDPTCPTEPADAPCIYTDVIDLSEEDEVL